jgi:hypothetical protein
MGPAGTATPTTPQKAPGEHVGHQSDTLEFVRPNGKRYKPRKPGLVAQTWEDNDCIGASGVIVFGTHDIAEATETAKAAVRQYFGCNGVTEAYAAWFRSSYRNGQPIWVIDTEKGRPGVSFQAVDL